MHLPATEAAALFTLRLNLAYRAAGRLDSGWNRRFLGALHGLLLELRPAQHPRDQGAWYPDGAPLLAPWPASGPGGWPGDSLICWGAAARASFNSRAADHCPPAVALAIHARRTSRAALPDGGPGRLEKTA